MRETGSFDRRKYVRIPTRQVVSISRADAAPRRALGSDISVSGIRFEIIGCEIELADVLTVDFQLEDQAVSALGRVVWCIDVDPIVQEVGFEFLELAPDSADFLQAFLGTLEPV